ncbi:molybdate ABC transporter, ATP-binding protein [Citrifermentans bemidjiense Bem]|uniref:Molybdate ABC transporter, ATP-binding protein n=1 Tax=Citrifermentans bemidjiense (strain ATCC BAA-1014 / DSM 16622 / JCM 12645 / Bem) TaxID=404380 RepID=B5EBW4_CITBB|nr:molybdenum ABC transporter ATP-binding protein [Citrifermentans bemidjiense]ACH38988.1 molybdate ABC transporter, ATP-binding protein [Citrifermentans bemidjiense Bem]
MELRIKAGKGFGGAFNLETDLVVSGDRVGVFGASGSGKSTLASLVAGLAAPDHGEIYLDGDCLYSSHQGINLPPQRRRVAVVFQDACLFPHLSVEANLRYGQKRSPKGGRKVDFSALVSVLKLEGLLERGVNKLSGGEKQRVALGRAILANPRLLLMDEPLSALDDTLKMQVMHYLKRASEKFGIPYLFISHSMLEIRLMTDQVLAMAGGRVTGHTTPEELARERMGQSQVGYINLLQVEKLRRLGGLYVYRWGMEELFVSAGDDREMGLFELSSRDIILFTRHPEAVSARNLLKCTVVDTFPSGNKVGVELRCGHETLIAEVVVQAADDLAIQARTEVYAVIKASSFRRLG